MKRRSLLKSLPAIAVLPVATAAPVLAKEETPVERLFRAWERETENVAAACVAKGMDDDTFTEIVQRQTDIEDQIAATPALNLRDFAMKAWARSSGGRDDLPNADELPALWAEVLALINA